MEWTPAEKAAFRKSGAIGGRTRAKQLSEKRRSEIGKMGQKESLRVRRANRDARLAQQAQPPEENAAA